MPAPVEQVHLDERRVSQLDDEDAIAGDGADRLDIDPPGERVEGVEDQPDVRMVRAPDDLPGVAMVADVPAPGERLVADAQAASRRQLAERLEIVGCPVDPAECQRRDVGAHKHQIGAQLAHQVELALGPVEGARTLRFRHSFEIAKGLEQRYLQPMIPDHPANFGRAAVIGKEIVLENLDTIKAGRRDGRELLAQIAADRHGGDGGLQRRGSFDGSASRSAMARTATG